MHQSDGEYNFGLFQPQIAEADGPWKRARMAALKGSKDSHK